MFRVNLSKFSSNSTFPNLELELLEYYVGEEVSSELRLAGS